MQREVLQATEQQRNFIDVLAQELETDSMALKIKTRSDNDTLSKVEASVSINYLLWRRAEKKTGVQLSVLLDGVSGS